MALNRWFWPVVVLVIGIAGVLELSSAVGETQTWDEGIHIASGYAYLTEGDYRWNVEHPPLVKLASALPLVPLGAALPVNGEGWKKFDEVKLGIDFLYGNRVPADSILLASRSITMLLSLFFFAAVAGWTKARFGAAAALLATVLCAFDPNLIAHARYVTMDVPVTVFYFFACVLWMDYLLSGRTLHLVLASGAFALAIATKFSAVLLIPTFTLLYIVRWFQSPAEFPPRRAGTAASALVAAGFLALNLVYLPETVRCWSSTVPRLDAVVDRGNWIGSVLYFAGRWLNLPSHAFFFGLSRLAAHNSQGHTSYLLGMRSERGWWYYFPVVFAVKSTVTAIGATALLLVGGIRAARWRKVPFLWIGLLFPPAFYFLVSMTSAINIGMRHILLVYPFLYIAAAVLLARSYSRRPAHFAMVALAVLQIAECARIAPDYLAFFNALSGGPGKGPSYLVDSNIDWGQDVKKLVKWLDAHGTKRARVAYFGNAQMRYYGLKELGFPPPLDQRAWEEIDDYAVASVTPLEGVYVPLNLLAPLRVREPIAKIGWSMYVYDLRNGSRR